jgi:uncharacterized membrane protein YdbT with pleckstrin-like domain
MLKEEGEKTKSKKFRTSRKAYAPLYLMIIIILVTILIIKISGRELNNTIFQIALIFVGFLLVTIEVYRYGIFYKITDSSLIQSKGILERKTRKVDLISISDADSKQTAWQRLLNYGDVNARMFSQDSTLAVKNINSPEEFADFLEEKMNEKRSSGKGGMGR